MLLVHTHYQWNADPLTQAGKTDRQGSRRNHTNRSTRSTLVPPGCTRRCTPVDGMLEHCRSGISSFRSLPSVKYEQKCQTKIHLRRCR